MAILVDESRWWFKEHHWCHMVSDTSFDELHAFAESMQIPMRAFHGDHYDVPAHLRDAVLERGAIVVTSRELVTRLVSAGLRMTVAQRRAYKHDADADHGSADSVSERGQ